MTDQLPQATGPIDDKPSSPAAGLPKPERYPTAIPPVSKYVGSFGTPREGRPLNGNQKLLDSKHDHVTKKPYKPHALTARSRQFLVHIASGRPTLEAYRLCGYKGVPHSAYQLRSDLKHHLATLLENGGFSREQLGIEINKLNQLPLSDQIRNVNYKQKIDLLRLMHAALPKAVSSDLKPKITPFKLNFNEPQKLTSIEGEVVHETELPQKDQKEPT